MAWAVGADTELALHSALLFPPDFLQPCPPVLPCPSTRRVVALLGLGSCFCHGPRQSLAQLGTEKEGERCGLHSDQGRGADKAREHCEVQVGWVLAVCCSSACL